VTPSFIHVRPESSFKIGVKKPAELHSRPPMAVKVTANAAGGEMTKH